LAAVDFAKFSEVDLGPLVEVLNAVPTAAAAERQLAILERTERSKAQLAEQLPSLAKRLPAARHAMLVDLGRRRFADDLETQAQLLRGLLDADAQRGAKLDADVRPWAESTARAYVAGVQADRTAKKIAGRMTTAAELVRRLELREAAAALKEFLADKRGDTDSRLSAAEAIVALVPDAVGPIVEVLNDPGRSNNERQRLAAILGKARTPAAEAALVESLQKAGASLRPGFAAALAGTLGGAEKLVEACAAGRVPAALLRDRGVVDRLQAHHSSALNARIAAITAKLPPANAEADAAIAERRTAFAAAKPDAARGAELFAKHCSACHTIGGKGGNIAPQLDGIGTRGGERLIEDILDPNRNVDRAFRSAVIVTSDGLVITGLVRRQEGKLLVLAESTGKERTLSVDDVESRADSETSIMPTGFNDALRGDDFFDLLAFLLAAKPAPH
jgi:putative heme-binding domain-containing protein